MPLSRRLPPCWLRLLGAAQNLVALGLVTLVVASCSTPPGPASGPSSGPPVNPPASGSADPPAVCSPSTALASWSDALDRTTFRGQTVGNLSGLAARPDGTVLALSDRSALFTLDATATRPLDAVLLADAHGLALDSEAVVADADGTDLITNETGPAVLRYDATGHVLGALPVPPELAVAPAGRSVDNATFEGLALSPDGRTLIASLEEPLRGDDPGLTRLVTWTRPSSAETAPAAGNAPTPGAQYAFPLPAGLGISELTPTGDGRLLVLERGYDKTAGNTVHLVLADPRGATDVGSVPALTPATAGSPVRTTLLADLGACPSLGATSRQKQTNPLLDNIEGMTVTGRDPDGALRLLLVSDNNDSASQIIRTYRLRTVLPPG